MARGIGWVEKGNGKVKKGRGIGGRKIKKEGCDRGKEIIF